MRDCHLCLATYPDDDSLALHMSFHRSAARLAQRGERRTMIQDLLGIREELAA